MLQGAYLFCERHTDRRTAADDVTPSRRIRCVDFVEDRLGDVRSTVDARETSWSEEASKGGAA